MYLSRIKMNLEKRKALIALGNPNIIHGILSASQSGQQKVLWRMDRFQGEYYLYFVSQSKIQPDFLQEQIGSEDAPLVSKNYDYALDNLRDGETYHFRITAVPTWSCSEKGKDGRGKKLSCHSDKMRKDWLIRKGQMFGFEVDPDSFLVTGVKDIRFKKRESKVIVQFQSVTFEGYLKVTDVEQFRHALTNGIGRDKAYGQGLLTISR